MFNNRHRKGHLHMEPRTTIKHTPFVQKINMHLYKGKKTHMVLEKRAEGVPEMFVYHMDCSVANNIAQNAKEMIDINLSLSSINCFCASSGSSLCRHLNKCIYLLKWHLYHQNNCKNWHFKFALYGN
jgi:hypothetical protein